MMKFILIIMTIFCSRQTPILIFEFNKSCPIELWQVVDDIVMGGKSNGSLSLSENGNGLFKGNVSIENNGGFSSIRLNTKKIKINVGGNIILNVKGDGHEYQLRIKGSRFDRHSFIFNFKTSGEWETISIPLNKMTASFRGYAVGLPDFNDDTIDQLGFLKSSKKNTSFKLEIKRISIN